MSNHMYHRVAKGIHQDGGNNNIMTWWKTNFNMPVPEIWNGNWVPDRGPFTYNGQATSFDLSGLVAGFELVVFCAGFHWEGPLSGTAYVYSEWRDENNNLLFTCADGIPIDLDIDSGYWYEYMRACNIGIAGWEVDTSGNYKVRSWSTGTGAMETMETTITFSNVPSTSQMSTSKRGYIWVEGNNLHFINNNRWEHSITGEDQGYVDTAKAGYIWIDTDNYLHWIGNDGHDYKGKWRIKQFASTFSNGPTGEVFAGTSKKGYIWVDNEFGGTHLSYIGNDGYKYLFGSGNYPYQYP